MIPKFSDAVTIDWERRDFEFKTVLTVQFCAARQYHIKDGDEVDFEEVKDFVVEQLRLEVANSVGGMLATAERETLVRRIDELCQENDQLRRRIDSLGAENDKLREQCADLHILCYPQSYEWEVTDHTCDKYSPCELCEKAHGGKSPCASTSEDLTEECCKPFQAKVVADRMRELGIEVPS